MNNRTNGFCDLLLLKTQNRWARQLPGEIKYTEDGSSHNGSGIRSECSLRTSALFSLHWHKPASISGTITRRISAAGIASCRPRSLWREWRSSALISKTALLVAAARQFAPTRVGKHEVFLVFHSFWSELNVGTWTNSVHVSRETVAREGLFGLQYTNQRIKVAPTRSWK